MLCTDSTPALMKIAAYLAAYEKRNVTLDLKARCHCSSRQKDLCYSCDGAWLHAAHRQSQAFLTAMSQTNPWGLQLTCERLGPATFPAPAIVRTPPGCA